MLLTFKPILLKNMLFRISFFLIISSIIISCNSSRTPFKSNIVLLSTTAGDIKIRLSDSTPVHRDNFLFHIREGHFNGVLFHRVINNFMIQTGDISTRADKDLNIPDSLFDYTIPPEIVSGLFHKKGAVAAARMGNQTNPEMRSSGTQFYIVQGTILTEDQLKEAENLINTNLTQLLFLNLFRHFSDSNRLYNLNLIDAEIQEKVLLSMYEILSSRNLYTIPDYQRNVYKTIGGVPRLDQTYTVFGEVIEGLDVVDRIASAQTDSNNKPLSDIRIIDTKILYK